MIRRKKERMRVREFLENKLNIRVDALLALNGINFIDVELEMLIEGEETLASVTEVEFRYETGQIVLR